MAHILKWLHSFFSWKPYRDTGIWRYEENAVSGKRRAIKVGPCFQPLMLDWLREGDVVVYPEGPITIGSGEWLARW
jgi:hypothetical protein